MMIYALILLAGQLAVACLSRQFGVLVIHCILFGPIYGRIFGWW